MNWGQIVSDAGYIGGQLRWIDPLTGSTEYVGGIQLIREPPGSNKVEFVLDWVAGRTSPDAPWVVDRDVPSTRLYRTVDCDKPTYRGFGVMGFSRWNEKAWLYDRTAEDLVPLRQIQGLSGYLVIVACADEAAARDFAAGLGSRAHTTYARAGGGYSPP